MLLEGDFRCVDNILVMNILIVQRGLLAHLYMVTNPANLEPPQVFKRRGKAERLTEPVCDHPAFTGCGEQD